MRFVVVRRTRRGKTRDIYIYEGGVTRFYEVTEENRPSLESTRNACAPLGSRRRWRKKGDTKKDVSKI